MAIKRKSNDERVAEAIRLARSGKTRDDIMAALGVSRPTMRAILTDVFLADPEVRKLPNIAVRGGRRRRYGDGGGDGSLTEDVRDHLLVIYREMGPRGLVQFCGLASVGAAKELARKGAYTDAGLAMKVQRAAVIAKCLLFDVKGSDIALAERIARAHALEGLDDAAVARVK